MARATDLTLAGKGEGQLFPEEVSCNLRSKGVSEVALGKREGKAFQTEGTECVKMTQREEM